MFVALSILRPALVLAISIPLVASGHGVEGALVGIAAGTLVALAVGLAITAGNYALSVSWNDAREIATRGSWFIPVVLSLWAVQNVDLYLVSLYLPDDDVALYRVGSRVGAVMSYFVSAFLIAWTPLTFTPLGQAVDEELGPTGLTGPLVTYFVAACGWILVGMAVFADLLVRIAPQSYGDAAPLIPLIGLGFVGYGGFIVVQRGSRFGNRREVYRQLCVLAGLLFLALSLILLPTIGAYGPPAAQIGAFGLVTAIIVFQSQRGDHPIDFEWRRLALIVVLAGGLIGVAHVVSALWPQAATAADLVCFASFPVLALLLGAIPREHLPRLLGMLRRPAGEHAHPPRRKLMARLKQFDDEDRRTLEAMIRDRHIWAESDDPEWMLARAVGALRKLGDIGRPTDADPDIARLLFVPAPVAERDRAARQLVARGVRGVELDALESLLGRVRGRRVRRFKSGPRAQLPQDSKRSESDSPVLPKALSADRPGPVPGEFLFSRLAPVPYFIQEGTERPDVLLVSFSAFVRPDAPPAYSNVRLLGAVPYSVLFTRPYDFYLGRNRDFVGRDATAALIKQVQANYGIEPNKLIAFGASQGAIAALTVGVFSEARHVLAAAPAVYIADAIPGKGSNAPLREHLMRYLAGGTDQESQDFLNGLVETRLSSIEAPTAIHAFSSPQDELFAHHVPALIALCKANLAIELHYTEGSYEGHKGVEEALRPWFHSTMEDILDGEDQTKPGGGMTMQRASHTRL